MNALEAIVALDTCLSEHVELAQKHNIREFGFRYIADLKAFAGTWFQVRHHHESNCPEQFWKIFQSKISRLPVVEGVYRGIMKSDGSVVIERIGRSPTRI